MKQYLALFAAALSLGMVEPVRAHHSFAAEFDGKKPMRIEGTLSKIEWTNPHSYFYVDVKDEKGNVATWGCEGANPGALSRRGFKKGDIIISVNNQRISKTSDLERATSKPLQFWRITGIHDGQPFDVTFPG